MEQIQRSINKITSIPARNNQEIESFDPLYAAEILFKFSKRAEDRRAFSLTNNMLQHYENDQLTNTDESNKLKIGLRYLYLGKTLDNPDFIKKGLKHLHHHLSNPIGNKTLSANNLESSIRNALIYLLIVADWNERLYELIMLYSTFDTDQ
jgi:hypothetical protein